jgi:hypothetical protein
VIFSGVVVVAHCSSKIFEFARSTYGTFLMLSLTTRTGSGDIAYKLPTESDKLPTVPDS